MNLGSSAVVFNKSAWRPADAPTPIFAQGSAISGLPYLAKMSLNLACRYSLNRQLDYARSALGKALAAGFKDCKLLREDHDLANLRSQIANCYASMGSIANDGCVYKTPQHHVCAQCRF